MKMLLLLLGSSLLLVPFLNAEEVIVIHDTEGGYVSYNIEDISKLDFSENDGMIVHHLDQQTEYALDEVAKITYNPDWNSVHESAETIVPPATFILHQAYPNPFNPSTNISYQLRADGIVKLAVTDVNGRIVKSLVSARQISGLYSYEWQGKNNSGQSVAAGLYFYRLSVDDVSQTRKMLLIK